MVQYSVLWTLLVLVDIPYTYIPQTFMFMMAITEANDDRYNYHDNFCANWSNRISPIKCFRFLYLAGKLYMFRKL
jgi:hypothetical protein